MPCAPSSRNVTHHHMIDDFDYDNEYDERSGSNDSGT